MAKHSKKKKRPPEVGRGNAAKPKEILPGKALASPWKIIVQALIIAAAALWIYGPALHGDWLWDDKLLVTDNAVLRDPSGLWKIWFDPGGLVDYQPLKVSVVWLQWQLWGDNTLGYHLTNVLLHIVGALLVWRLLSKFRLRLAWLGGLIFAVHPVQVESVAWIAELKNTLSLPPFLLAICAWIDFDECGKKSDYFLALGLFLVAMLCKATMVMFPAVILLYAWWKRGRIGWKDLKTSAPFFLVSLAVGLVTVWFLQHHTIGDGPVPMGGLFSRLACAGLAGSFYFSKCFLPMGLIPIYPKWVIDPPTLLQFLPWPLLLAMLVWLWTKRGSWGRHALLGLGFFLINLLPFVGLNAASYMAFTWVMDHVLYIPMIGLIGLAVAAWGEIENQLPAFFRPCGIGLAFVVLAPLAFESHGYAALYVNSETLWAYELRYNPDAYPAYNNLGNVLLEKRRFSEAKEQFEQALRIYPDDAEVHNNLGCALGKTDRFAEATEQFELALQIQPDYAEARYNLGNVLLRAGRTPEAIEQYQCALQIKPDYAEAHANLGDALELTGRFPEAIEQYQDALRTKPDDAEVHNNLGCALEQTNRVAEATEQFELALHIQPDYAEARYNLGNLLFQTGRTPEAIEQYQQALRIKPDYVAAHNNLGNALQQSGRLSEAIEQYEQALQINPNYAAARNNLAKLQALQKTAPAKQ